MLTQDPSCSTGDMIRADTVVRGGLSDDPPATGHAIMRKAYPSDPTDQQWAIIAHLIPVHRVGRPRIHDMQDILNAIFYITRAGCQWDMLPHDLPAKSTVYDYFA